MNSIEKRLKQLEKLRPFAGFDSSRPMVVVLRDGDPDPPERFTDGPGPLIIDCRQRGRELPYTG